MGTIIVTETELARLCGVQATTIKRWRIKGRITPDIEKTGLKIEGNRYFYTDKNVEYIVNAYGKI